MYEIGTQKKIELVNEAYKKVREEHKEYIGFLTEDVKAIFIQEKLPQVPIYGVRSIIQVITGTGYFKISKKHRLVFQEVHREVIKIAPANHTLKWIALTIRERLPTRPLYNTNTIKQIINGNYNKSYHIKT